MIVTPKILLVEDEEVLGLIIKDSLEQRGFDVMLITDGQKGYAAYQIIKPALLILDVMLPSISGLQLANEIRTKDKNTPILFLTARTMPNDVVNGYMAGGNDYLKKPFEMEELIIRVKVLLNQNRLLLDDLEESDGRLLQLGSYSFDVLLCQLNHHTIVKKLTSREAEVLKMLCQHHNRMLSRRDLLVRIWGVEDFFSSRSLDVYITKLRKYLQLDPTVQIINHRGFGYKLVF